MLQYAPPAYRPTVVTSPTMRRQAPRLVLGQQFENYLGWPAPVGDGIRLIFHGATAALGYHIFKIDKGFWKWFGLLLGIGQTVGFICDAMSLFERAIGTHPPETPSPQRTATPNA
jgi:hypothetical protein